MWVSCVRLTLAVIRSIAGFDQITHESYTISVRVGEVIVIVTIIRVPEACRADDLVAWKEIRRKASKSTQKDLQNRLGQVHYA
jgi:hypothetical protein